MSQNDRNSSGISWTKSQIHEYIEEAKRLVADEEEPFKTAAFQIVLSNLLSGKSFAGSKEATDEEVIMGDAATKIEVPDDLVNYITGLGDPDKIPILWSMSTQEWMKVDDFLSAAAEAGMTIARSWSPKQGGNFNNRLYREKKLFVKKGEGKEATYKLSAEGKQRVKELLEQATQG